MKCFTIAALAFFSMAMGGTRPQPAPGETPNAPASVAPYDERFRSLAKVYGADLKNRTVSYSFRSFFGTTVGMCSFSSSGRNSVQFSSSAWSKGSDTFKEMLAFHELGHCLLGRGHLNDTHGDGRPESLMNSWLFNQNTYLANRDAYMKELFTAESDWAVRAATRSRRTDFGDCTFGK